MSQILLVRPDGGGNMLPNGIMYISSYLKKFGYDSIIRDLTFQKIEKVLWDMMKIGHISIVGISMLSNKKAQAHALITAVKKTNKDIKIIIGGMHATALPKLLVDNLQIDAAVIGEGEITMKELADFWIEGKGELKNIKGIATREHGIHEPRELIENLDDIPMPDYDNINFDFYYSAIAKARPNEIVNGVKISEAKYANIISSRGCKGRCMFCSAYIHWKSITRFRSADNILEEIKYLYERGIRIIQIADDSFGQNKEIAIDMCRKLIENGMKIAWHTDMRVDGVDEELLTWMKKSGCFVIAYGIESGSEKILKNINKGITKEQIRNAIKLTKKVGIRAYALLMVGNIGETDETIVETINLMNELQPDIWSSVGFVMTCPGTAYYNIMEKKGMINDKQWIEGEDGLPVFIDNFNRQDLYKWYTMMTLRIPKRW